MRARARAFLLKAWACRICGRCAAWRTPLALSICIPSFGPRSPLRAASSLRRACRAALALQFCVVDLGKWHGAGLTCPGRLHVGWGISLLDIESSFANVLVCAGLFAQETGLLEQ